VKCEDAPARAIKGPGRVDHARAQLTQERVTPCRAGSFDSERSLAHPLQSTDQRTSPLRPDGESVQPARQQRRRLQLV